MTKTITNVVRYALVSLCSFLFISSAKADVAEIYQPFMANFANRIMTITSSGNAGAGVDLGGSATFALFDPSTGADTTTTFTGNQNTQWLPGHTGNTLAWRGFCDTQAGYVSPGLVMRFAPYVDGRSITVGGTFSPLNLGGLIVEEGAASGSTIPSLTQGGDRTNKLGDTRANGGVPTFFVLRDSFKINRKGFVNIYGDITFDIASGKYFDCNTANSAQSVSLQTDAIFRMVGEGEFKVSTLTATGVVTLDYSKQSTQRATPFITGNLTVDGNTKLVFPANLTESTDFVLCSGTLSGVATGMREITVGAKTGFATLTFTDNKVSYVWINEKSEVTIGADMTWAQVTQLEGYKGTLPTTINLEDDVEIDFAEAATTPILTFKGAYTVTLVYNKTPTIPEIKVANDASFKILIPDGSDYTDQAIPAGATSVEFVTSTGADFSYGTNNFIYNYTGDSEVTPTITGTGAFTKAGAGTIVFQSSFNPASITIVEGVAKRPTGTAWAFNKSITVLAGGQFYENGGYDKGGITYTIAGAGPNGESAAIVESESDCGGGNANCAGITLSNDATFKTEDDFYMIGGGYAANTIALGNYTLTKTGDAKFYLCNTTINGTGTFKIAAGALDFCNNRTCSIPNGTLELDGGNLNLSQAFTVKNLTIKNGAVTGNGALTLTGAFKVAGSADMTALPLPLTQTLAADSMGTLKIVKPTKAAKLIAGTTIPESLTIADEEGNAIAPLCIYDGYICYGTVVEGEYTLTTEDTDALQALPAGGIYAPLIIGATSVAGVPEEFIGWMDNGAICIAKKSNSISLKTGTRTTNYDSAIRATDASVGGFPVAGKFWNNAKISNGNNEVVQDYTKLLDGNGEDVGVTVAYYAPNTYFASGAPTPTCGNMRLLSTYLDDGASTDAFTVNTSSQGLEIPEGGITLPVPTENGVNIARGWEFEISNIPYEMYDLYVYVASDQGADLKACPVGISCDNGANWTFYAGPNKATSSTSWKASPYSSDGTITEGAGGNYIRFRVSKNSTGLDDISNLLITHGTRNTGNKTRLGLAGIQIVEIDDDGVRDRVVSGQEIQSWHDADSWTMNTKEGVKTVAWVDSTEETPITARIDASKIATITMDSDVAIDKLVITGESEVFTINGSAALAVKNSIDATEFSGKLVFTAPVTGALSLGENAKLVVNIEADEEVAVEELLPAGLTIASGSVTITGSGTIVADGALPTAYQSSFQADTWTGTLYLKGFNWNDYGFGAYGHAGSKIKVTGVTGFGPNSTGDGVNPELILEDIAATEQDPAVKALLVNNGYSNKDYFFRKVTGSGTFGWDPTATQGPGSGQTYIFKDISDFDGVFDTGVFLKIVVGDTTAGSDKGSITFADGIEVKANLDWKAQKAYFGETLTIDGEVGDTLVSGLTAAPTSVPTVTLVGDEEGVYTLKYAEGALTIAIADVEVAIPAIEGAYAEAYDEDGKAYEIADDKVVIPYGSYLDVYYFPEEGRIFSDGEEMKQFTFEEVTEAPIIDVTGITTEAIMVEVVIPELAGTTVKVWSNGIEITPVKGKVNAFYNKNLTVMYTPEEGKLFTDGQLYLPLLYFSVTKDPDIANDENFKGAEIVDAGAKIGTTLYFTIADALNAAASGQLGNVTVVVLQDAQLESLTVSQYVTLDLNNKTVQVDPANITNNGTIVVYDEATTMALVDTHGTIEFGTTVMLSVGYMFPEGTIVTVKKVQGVPGATRSVITVPENSVLMNLVGAAAKKDIAVQFENPMNSTLLLAGAIERGSHDYDTILNVGGITTIGAPLIIGLDGEGMDYETYPNDKATLSTTYLQFDEDLLQPWVKDSIYACIQLIPEVGILKTATNLASVIGDRLVTIPGAEIKDDFDGTIHTYTAEWIYPEAEVEEVTPAPEDLDVAFKYTAKNDAPHYDAETASFVLTTTKAIPAGAIQLGGKFADMGWNIYELPEDIAEGGSFTVVEGITWSQVKAISPFTCGAKSIALTEDTEVTLTLKLGEEVIDTQTITLKAAGGGKIVPEEQGTVEVTGEGEDAVAAITPKEGVTKLDITMPAGFAGKYEIPSSITQITGVEINQLIIKSNGFDIAPACKIEGGNIVLDATKSVTVGEETIPVTPTLTASDDEVKPLVVSDEETAVGVKAIPGLTYTLVRSTALGGEETSVASDTATTARVTLTDTFEGGKPTSAFYVIKVTK